VALASAVGQTPHDSWLTTVITIPILMANTMRLITIKNAQPYTESRNQNENNAGNHEHLLGLWAVLIMFICAALSQIIEKMQMN